MSIEDDFYIYSPEYVAIPTSSPSRAYDFVCQTVQFCMFDGSGITSTPPNREWDRIWKEYIS